MNKITIAVGLILSFGLSYTNSAFAGEGIPMGPVNIILENASEVKHNAGNYQWTRVNHEVDRIVAAEGKLIKSLDMKSASSVKDAVKSLRSARLAHDSDRCIEAAGKLMDVVKSISK